MPPGPVLLARLRRQLFVLVMMPQWMLHLLRSPHHTRVHNRVGGMVCEKRGEVES